MEGGSTPERRIGLAGEAALRRQIESTEKSEEEEGRESTTRKNKESEDSTSIRHLSLKVVNQNGNEVFFKIKPHTTLNKLMDAYCGRHAISSSSVRFLYDGMRVMPESTPETLDMDDGDIIDVVLQQTGG